MAMLNRIQTNSCVYMYIPTRQFNHTHMWEIVAEETCFRNCILQINRICSVIWLVFIVAYQFVWDILSRSHGVPPFNSYFRWHHNAHAPFTVSIATYMINEISIINEAHLIIWYMGGVENLEASSLPAMWCCIPFSNSLYYYSL